MGRRACVGAEYSRGTRRGREFLFFFFFNANYVFLLVDAILIYLKISEAIESDKKFVAVAFPIQQLDLFIGESIAARARAKNESDIFSLFAEDDTNMYV